VLLAALLPWLLTAGAVAGALTAIGVMFAKVTRTRIGHWIGQGVADGLRHDLLTEPLDELEGRLVGAFESALAHELTPFATKTARLDRRVDHLEIINRDTALAVDEIADDLSHLRDQLDVPRPPVIPPRRRRPDDPTT